MITAKEFMIFLNKEVMCEEAVVKIMGEGKQICEDTARLWLHKLNCKYVAKQKSYYTDTHEKYIEYRAHFLQRCSKCSKKTQAQPAPNKKKRIARNAKTAPIDSSRRASLQPSSVFFGAPPGLARGLSEMRRV